MDPCYDRPPMNLRNLCAALGAGILSLTLVACGGGDASLGPDDDVAITIGDVTITNGQIERRAESLAKAQATQAQQAGQPADAPAKDSEEFADLRRTAAEQLRDEQVFAILAKQCGAPCNVTKKDINTQIGSIIQQSFNGSRPDFDKALEEQGMTMADLQDAFRASLQEDKLSGRVTKKITFDEAQAKAYFTKNIATYRTPAEKRVAHILVGTKKVADDLRPQLNAANFAEMAKTRSLDPAAKTTGGDLGPVTGSGLFPEMQAVVQKLKPGQISQPVQTQFGWSVLTVRQIPATTKSFASVKDEIMAEQLQIAQSAALEKWRNTAVRKVQDSATFQNDRVKPTAETDTDTPAEEAEPVVETVEATP